MKLATKLFFIVFATALLAGCPSSSSNDPAPVGSPYPNAVGFYGSLSSNTNSWTAIVRLPTPITFADRVDFNNQVDTYCVSLGYVGAAKTVNGDFSTNATNYLQNSDGVIFGRGPFNVITAIASDVTIDNIYTNRRNVNILNGNVGRATLGKNRATLQQSVTSPTSGADQKVLCQTTLNIDETPPVGAPSLFVAGGTGAQIQVFNNAPTANGNVAPAQNIVGGMTSMVEPCDIAYDNERDIIYTADWNSGVLAFDNASNPMGNVAPTRIIDGALTGFTNICGIEIDELNDRLYVAGAHGISVYNIASTVNGNVAPDRLITGAATLLPSAGELRPFLDTRNDRLYIASPSSVSPSILVFNSASTIDGNVAPNRVITGANTTFNYPWGISVDVPRDKLYVGDSSNNAIFVFDNASAVTGNVAPNRTVSGGTTGLTGGELADIYVDPIRNMIYAVLRTANQISVWDSASTIDGDIAPDRAITGANTTLTAPDGIVGVYR